MFVFVNFWKILSVCSDKSPLNGDTRVLDKVCSSISIMPISLANPMFDHLLESSRRDDSNKWLNIGFAEASSIDCS